MSWFCKANIVGARVPPEDVCQTDFLHTDVYTVDLLQVVWLELDTTGVWHSSTGDWPCLNYVLKLK